MRGSVLSPRTQRRCSCCTTTTVFHWRERLVPAGPAAVDAGARGVALDDLRPGRQAHPVERVVAPPPGRAGRSDRASSSAACRDRPSDRRPSSCPSRRPTSPDRDRPDRTGSCRAWGRCGRGRRGRSRAVTRPAGPAHRPSAGRVVRLDALTSGRPSPLTWRSTKPSGRPRSARPHSAGSRRARSAKASTSAKPSRRPSLGCGQRAGSSPRTTSPRRRSMMKKSAPSTLGSSQKT